MKTYHFKGLLQSQGWLENTFVSIDGNGIIQSIQDQPNAEQRAITYVNGYALPGFQNAHSHAFQYAMAGLAEIHKNKGAADDFWAWREAMYQVALTMDPDDLENIASMLYAEMVRHGYTHVAEFHYLHHDKTGSHYSNPAEHADRLIAAAQRAGIKITLIPMFYQKGGFGKEPNERQRRFISKTPEEYWQLWEASKKACGQYSRASIGFGIHSLRAVSPDDIILTLQRRPNKIPFHIHVAEQLKEIEDAVNYLKQRPVEWLLDHVPVDDTFHLVHATHLTENEVNGITVSAAHVVLCPSTEGNLGDGLFPLRQFQNQGGKWSIGTDSHISLNPLEELRLLDYGQRLISHKRNTFTNENQSDSGAYAIHQALLAGRRAMGNHEVEYFKVGQPLDAVVYDTEGPLLAASSLNKILSTILYATDASYTLATIVDGKYMTTENRQTDREGIQSSFLHTMKKLAIK